jgi:GAF domain-containing protein
MSKRTVIVAIVVGCILLSVANVSLWATHTIFNPERFGGLVTEGLQSDQATQAIAEEVVDHLLEDYPAVRAIASSMAEELLTALLQHPVLTPVIEKVAAGANLVLTTDITDIIPLELQEMIPFVVGVIYAIDPDLVDQISAELSSSPLALLNPNELPNLRTASRVLPWLWPFALLGAVGLFVAAIRYGPNRAKSMVYTGAGIAITGGLMLLFVPAIRSASTGAITTSIGRIVVGEVVDTLLRGYAIQDVLLIVVGIALYIEGRRRLTNSEVISEDQAETAM